MKLNSNEQFVLGILLKNLRALDSEISKKIRITSQAVGKIRKQLLSKGIIKDQYFRNLLKRFGSYVEIKHSFVFSSGSIIKSSSKDMFLEVLKGLERGKNV